MCTPHTSVAGECPEHFATAALGQANTPQTQQDRHPSLAPRGSPGHGNTPGAAPTPMVYGPWGNQCYPLFVNHPPNFLSLWALHVCDTSLGYIKPIAQRTRNPGSHGHIAATLQKERKIQGTSGTVIYLTYPEYIHVLISINTPISPYGWVYIYMYQSQNTTKFLLASFAEGVMITDKVLWSL